MKKKLILSLLVICLGVLFLGIVTVNAATYGDYTYTVSNGEVTITDFNTSVSGAITIPSEINGYPVTSIGYFAFYQCTGLTSVEIPDSVTSIGNSAFRDCTGLTSINVDPQNEYYCSVDGNVFNKNKTEIIQYAIGKSSKSYIIPDSVTSIGDYAFYKCTGLTSVTIGDGVTSIGSYAFEDCTGLTSVEIPDSVESIGGSAFYNCTGLTSVEIPDSVTSIGDDAFSYCTGLTRVDITDIEAWCNISFSGYSSNPLYYAENLYLNGELVKDLTIPDGVTSIGSYAFRNCTGLTSVEIPDGVTSIGGYAFAYCTGLTSVEIPDSVISIGNFAFEDCTGLTSVEIPDSVTSIGGSAFRDCTWLTSVEIPDGVTSIGYEAFYNCTGLTRVDITDIEAWCNISFSGYSSNPLYYAKKLYLNGKLVTNLTIPDGVESIGSYAFAYCTGLTSVEIPDSVKSIGNCAFYYCTGLTSVTIGNGVTSIGDSVFCYCTGLTSVTIGNSVESIGSSAFYYCTGLTRVDITDIEAWCNISFYSYYSNPLYYAKKLYLNGKLVTNLTIPDSVTSIGYEAFYNCTGLTSVEIPDSVTSIGNYAFYNCTGLTSVNFGKGVELIPESAFYSCSNLKYVCIPQNVKYIRNDAFNGCSKIETVFYEGSEELWNNILFYNRNENLTNAKIVYNAKKRTYKFETNCEAVLSDVNHYALFTAPVVKNGEKTLAGWYDNAELSGEPISFPYYGDAEVLYAAWTDRTGLTFDDAFIAKENRQYTVTTTQSGQIIYYEFVPKYSGEYRFYSTGNLDTYCYLYNSSRSQITYNDDGGEGNNFYIARNLTAGETYYIGAKVYSGTGTFTLVIETDCVPGTKTVCVTASDGEKIFISIPSYLPEDSRIILACYDGERFVTAKSAPNKNETIYFVIDKEFDSAKVMVWEDFNTLVPITEVENVEL